MSLKLVPPAFAPESSVKVCALVAFRAIRIVQAKAAQIPGVLQQVRNDVVSAWRESADSLPNV